MSETKELYIVSPQSEGASNYKVPAEVYSRIVGYLRPIQNWNEGKQQEFADRKMFKVPAPEESKVVKAAFDSATALPVIEWFFARVCELAESRIEQTGKVEGQHYAAMQLVIQTLKDEANGPQVRNDLETPMTLPSESVPFEDTGKRKRAIAHNHGGKANAR